MFHQGKLPEPDQIDGIGPLWNPARIERWAEREWWYTRRWRCPRELPRRSTGRARRPR
jgi:hypothetical protein